MEIHPAANLFPMMSDSEYAELCEDVRLNGLREAIWVDAQTNSILDGRNRWKACQEIGIDPVMRSYDGDDPYGFVMSMNLHRRHLTASQRAMIAVRLEAIYAQEARARQGQRTDLMDDADIPANSRKSHAAEKAGQQANVGSNYVSKAKRITNEAPDIAQRVVEGDLNLSAAEQLLRLDPNERAVVWDEIDNADKSDEGTIKGADVRRAMRKVNMGRKQAHVWPDGMYRVWYADPPWQYGNSGVITDNDAYGRAERHYPVMSTDDICDMGDEIKKHCTDDAVLFLWVTSPLLPDGLRVMEAWGFKYKSSFVWDKVAHNFAHYNSMRHEFLLIGTKGSCTPDEQDLFDSVQVVNRSDVHSQKPDVFRTIIETLYTWGDKIELFARDQYEGWDMWGNEQIDTKENTG